MYLQGSTAIADGATTVNVSFGSAFDTVPQIIIPNVANTSADEVKYLINATVTSKTATGCVVELSAATNTANYVLQWVAGDPSTLLQLTALTGVPVSQTPYADADLADTDQFVVNKAGALPVTSRVPWSRIRSKFLQRSTAPTTSTSSGDNTSIAWDDFYIHTKFNGVWGRTPRTTNWVGQPQAPGGDPESGFTPLAHTRAVFVAAAPVGNDANAGTSSEAPKATIRSAINAASALITAGAAGVKVTVMDGNTYSDNSALDIPTTVHVSADAATYIGNVRIAAFASFSVNRHLAPFNNSFMAQHLGPDGPAFYNANINDGRGLAAYTGVRNVYNGLGTGKNFFVRIGVMYVGVNGVGLGDVGEGDAGHIHFNIPDIYLAGNNAVGIRGAASGANAANIIGFCDHILTFGSPTGVTGIQVLHADAKVRIVAAEINVGATQNAYNATAGELYLVCPRIIGYRIGGIAACEISNVLVSTSQVNAVNGAFSNLTAGQLLLPVSGNPNARGGFMIQAVNDTTLAFRYKGFDDVVRSAVLTLS